jgi:hypothetical protein
VDPCLGFYQFSPSPLSRTFHQEVSYEAIRIIDDIIPLNSTPQFDSLDIPEWTHTSEYAIGAEVEDDRRNDIINVVTVDDFLRRSAEKPRKNYGKRKRKVANLTSGPQGSVTVALIGC